MRCFRRHWPIWGRSMRLRRRWNRAWQRLLAMKTLALTECEWCHRADCICFEPDYEWE